MQSKALTPQQREEIMEILGDALQEKPWDEAWALCRDYLEQYPEDLDLKLTIGSAIPVRFSGLTDSEERDRYWQIAIDLCTPAAESGEPALRRSATRMLAAFYMGADQLDKAEALIRAESEDRFGAPDLRLASILLRKGELAQAELMFQQKLFELVSDFEMALAGLASVSHKLGNTEREILLWETIPKLTELVKMGKEPLNAYLALAGVYAAQENEPKAMDYLEAFARSMENLQKNPDYSDNPYFHRLSSGSHMVVSSVFGNEDLLQEIRRFQQYPALRDSRRLKELIARLEC